jgi:acetyl-CoA synthetase
MISPLPGVTTLKPGSASGRSPASAPRSSTTMGDPVPNGRRLPRAHQAVAGDAARHLGRPGALPRHLLVALRPQYYFAGDGAKLDEEGNIWLLGRVDDVMNVSGHRLSTTEIESALVSHPKVAEAAVVGANDEMTGQAIVAFVILRAGASHADDDNTGIVELRNHVAKEIGPIAKPKRILIVPSCPRPGPGKIMRRLLRDVAEGRRSATPPRWPRHGGGACAGAS